MLEYLITTYGYPALLVGAIVEGEVALVIAGFAAYLGYMNLPVVIALGFIGSLIGDQTYFYIGRKKGRELLQKWPKLKKRAKWAHKILDRHSNWMLLLFRFAYGFRAIVPITIGTSQISAKRFTLFNTIGAAIWSALFSVGGYIFGTTLSTYLADIKHYEMEIVGAIIIAALILWVFIIMKKKEILKGIEIDSDMII
jgi:membrane protein DedA with SNARE-associated domain